jgi:nucleoside-diphosphate-sugar epimerase
MAGDRTLLVIGAAGQIGNELVEALRARHGGERVVAGCRTTAPEAAIADSGPVEYFDATDSAAVEDVVRRHDVKVIYNLATILSGEGEQKPQLAWHVNIASHKAVLDIAVDRGLDQVFWPSSIAVFGSTTPADGTPQHTVLEPETMYGVTKVAGENLSNYYFARYGLDVRSLRYPGLVTVRKFSGGGTSDYTVEMLLAALDGKPYTCFVREDTVMPLMAMQDAIDATIALMEAPADRISIRTSYNIAALSFMAGELADEVTKHVPDFTCTYEPDFRQAIADSWPNTIDDSVARNDWGWQEKIDLSRLVTNILKADARR